MLPLIKTVSSLEVRFNTLNLTDVKEGIVHGGEVLDGLPGQVKLVGGMQGPRAKPVWHWLGIAAP